MDAAQARRGGWRHWRSWALAATGLACAVLVAVAVAASRYQPVGVSESDMITGFVGIPSGVGIRDVNDFGGLHQDIYIPPQRGTFALSAVIANNGTHAVSIVSAWLDRALPLALAGPVRYSTPGMGGSIQIPPPTSKVLHDVVLGPGQEMFIGFPVKMWSPCTTRGGSYWAAIPYFYVQTRYLAFTHTVAVPWGPQGDNLIMQWGSGKPGQKGATCAPLPTRAHPPAPPNEVMPPASFPGPQPIAGTVIRVYRGHHTGELRLTELTGPDAAENSGAPLPPCIVQYSPGPAGPRGGYRVVYFDLNWADINEGTRGTAPAIRVTITGPDGQVMIADVPQGPAYTTLACRPVRSFALGSMGPGLQLDLGLALRVPARSPLDHLLISAGGHTITVPLVPVCSRTLARSCFQGDQLGGPWIAGTPYSRNLRL